MLVKLPRVRTAEKLVEWFYHGYSVTLIRFVTGQHKDGDCRGNVLSKLASSSLECIGI